MHTKLTAAVVLGSLLFPLPAISAGTIDADDTVAGLGTSIHLQGFAPSAHALVTVTSPSGTVARLDAPLDANGSATLRTAGSATEQAGTHRMHVRIDNSDALGAFTVLPDKLDPRASRMDADTRSILPNGIDEATVTVRLTDRYGNALADRPVKLISSRSADSVVEYDRHTDARGEQRFGVRSRVQGSFTLRALDLLSDTMLDQELTLTAGSSVGGEQTYAPAPYPPYPDPYGAYRAQLIPSSYAQNFDVIAGFRVTVQPQTLKANEVGNLTIEAVDRAGETVEDYVGTVAVFAPSDPNATLPGLIDEGDRNEGIVTFSPKNLGKKFLPLSLSFTRSGEQTVRVEDRTDPSRVIEGESNPVIVQGESIDPAHKIEILEPRKGFIASTDILLKGIGPKLADILVMEGGEEIARGESDGTGRFSIPLSLRGGKQEYTLNIVDGSGRYRSGNIDLRFDTVGPPVQDIRFTPATPQQGDSVLAVAGSEPGLTDIVLRVAGEEIPMAEIVEEPGTYQTLFTAPKAGTQRLSVIARDDAGNRTELQAQLTVAPRGLPKVQRVTAAARGNGVELNWEAVTDEDVTSYMIYWGKDPLSLEAKDTGSAQNGALLAGLEAGVTYTFQVTAKSGERESTEKSDPVTAVPVGMKFTVTPGDGSLGLAWEAPDSLPLSSFLLEYGADPAKLTEKRLFNPQMRTAILRDLINGITYHLKLTPIETTGKILSDIAATATGAPDGEGFHPAPGCDPDTDPTCEPIDPAPPPPPDRLGETGSGGLSRIVWWFAGALTFALAYFQWRRRKHLRQTAAFLHAMQVRYKGS